MARVVFEDVSKVFGGVTAVKDLTLTVESGEFVSLLGPSGCGKTTTLRMLAGLEEATTGTISIGERIVNDVAPSKRDIAMVFQSYALYPHMTVAQNIEYPLRKRRIPKADRPEMVRNAARLLQLEDLLNRKPRQLSGGQQQRVALGRALVRNPAVFLLDEPLSNLDAKLRAHMRAELIQLRQRIGKTMVYVTHDQLEAMTMSDRIAILSDGLLQQYASPDEVYNRPANRFVAGFIGTPSMNLIDGTVAGTGDAFVFSAGSFETGIPGHMIEPQSDGSAATLGVRPEDVLIDPDGSKASVTVVEPTGHESIIIFDLAGNRVVGRFGPEVRLRAGDSVGLTFRTERLQFFAGDDGRRLNTDADAPAQQARKAGRG